MIEGKIKKSTIKRKNGFMPTMSLPSICDFFISV